MRGRRRRWAGATEPAAIAPAPAARAAAGATPAGAAIYLAPAGLTAPLVEELGDVYWVEDRLIAARPPARPVVWAQNVWLDTREVPIRSIRDGAAALIKMHHYWSLWSMRHHRRARLIEAALPHVATRPLEFPAPLPVEVPGAWTLVDEHTILAAPRCTSPFAHGRVAFVEDHDAPPSRAYLKLWELFTLTREQPAPGARCLDLGASPGGWTWVLQRLGAHVIAIDKAPLDARVARLPRVEVRRADALAVRPADVGPVDWLFCDVLTTPERLLATLQRWIESDLCRRFVCTVKFRGDADAAQVRALAALPGASLRHLYNNRNELTLVIDRAAGDRPP